MDYTNILTEYGVRFLQKENKLIVKCPFHYDTNPSAVLFLDGGKFHCSACTRNASFYDFLGRSVEKSAGQIHYELEKDKAEIAKTISRENIDRFHSYIYNESNKKLLNALYERAIPDKIIKDYKLGVFKNGIAIPIPNQARLIVNVRIHTPGAKKNKVISKAGYGNQMSLYPISQLAYDDIVLVGGELKALAGLNELNKHGIGCISGTHGEGSWTKETLSHLVNRNIYVCMDIDEAGKKASEKLCALLQGNCAEIYKIELPLDKKEFPKGDINDFCKKYPGELINVVKNAELWKFTPELEYDETEEPKEISLSNAILARNAKKRVKFVAVASAVEEAPFSLPKQVQIKCNRDAKGLCSLCQIPKACDPNYQILEVQKESPVLLSMAGRSDREHHMALLDEFKIPKTCKMVSFEPQTFYNVESTRISEQLDLSNRAHERSMQSAYLIGDHVELNESYEMVGRMFPHPQTQQATLLISEYKATQDALSNYVCEKPEKLNVFQPSEWTVEAVRDKLNDIYTDFEANVTRIFQRRAFHLGCDLTYHSPLLLSFDNSEIKGWVETLVVGDSSQGKSETIQNLIEFYGLGEKVDCKGATEAGLKGGLQKFNNTWFVTWGKFPENDRRMIVLEELKGTSTDVISKLTDMRSSGVAELTKIEKRRAHARTRMLATSNPRSIKPISAYNYGLDAIVELIGSLEDIRRFDLCLILEQSEVDTAKLQKFRPSIEHKYTAELCRELILWCWTVKKATFEHESKIFDAAISLCNKFVDTIPIVDRGSMRLKVARLSAALAGRTFSHDRSYNVLVRDCHIDFIEDFLIREYSKESFGYLEYSKKKQASINLVNEQEIIRKINTDLPFPRDFVENTIEQDKIDLQYLQDISGWDHITARELLSFLFRNRALERKGKYYTKTTQFNSLLKQMCSNGLLKGRPDHIPEEDKL